MQFCQPYELQQSIHVRRNAARADESQTDSQKWLETAERCPLLHVFETASQIHAEEKAEIDSAAQVQRN